MRYPSRLPHLVTDAVLVARLAPSYAQAHRVDHEEAQITLTSALRSDLREDLLEETWLAIRAKAPRLREETALEKLATALGDRPTRPGRVQEANAAWSAFWIAVGLRAGTASDSARAVLETDAGRAKVREGMGEAGRFLAAELTRT